MESEAEQSRLLISDAAARTADATVVAEACSGWSFRFAVIGVAVAGSVKENTGVGLQDEGFQESGENTCRWRIGNFRQRRLSVR